MHWVKARKPIKSKTILPFRRRNEPLWRNFISVKEQSVKSVDFHMLCATGIDEVITNACKLCANNFRLSVRIITKQLHVGRHCREPAPSQIRVKVARYSNAHK